MAPSSTSRPSTSSPRKRALPVRAGVVVLPPGCGAPPRLSRCRALGRGGPLWELGNGGAPSRRSARRRACARNGPAPSSVAALTSRPSATLPEPPSSGAPMTGSFSSGSVQERAARRRATHCVAAAPRARRATSRGARASVRLCVALRHARAVGCRGAGRHAILAEPVRAGAGLGEAAGDEARLPAGGPSGAARHRAMAVPGKCAALHRLVELVIHARNVLPVIGRARAGTVRRDLRSHHRRRCGITACSRHIRRGSGDQADNRYR